MYGSAAGGLRVLSLVLGSFLIFMGLGKLAWLTDSGLLIEQLQGWREFTSPSGLWYLDVVAIPGAPIFARLVLFGELTAGVAMVIGFRVHIAACVTLFMVLNFHFAMGLLFTAGYLTNGYGLPVVGGLAALALGGDGCR